MLVRSFLTAMVALAGVGVACGQAVPTGSGSTGRTWRSSAEGAPKASTASAASAAAAAAASSRMAAGNNAARPLASVESDLGGTRQSAVRVTNGDGKLPNTQGQVWREYDISSYTLRVASTNRPQQAIVDWILRETGYEAWHSEPLGILSATDRTLRVYHTPEMQAVVTDIVNRFAGGDAETRAFGLRVVSVDHPNWRAKAKRLMKPVQVQAPGVQAWLLERENAAILLAELQRRSDYREHSSPHLMVNNGQSTVVSGTRPRSYPRDVILRPNAWPGFEADMGQIDEGFSLEFIPLMSVDGRTIDATIKCNIDQVEKMIAVMLDVPSVAAPRQRTKIEVPQMAQFRFHERFRWPDTQVLLVGMGMVAVPVPAEPKPLVPGLPLPLPKSPARADLLVFVESKGKTGEAPRVTGGAKGDAKTYRGRY